MIRNDLSRWPLVISVASGAPTPDEHAVFLTEWTGRLDRGEPFAVLRQFTSAAALIHPEGGARRAKQWMEDNGVRIRRTVIALASVMQADEYERMKKMNIEKAFGVPGGIFADADAALSWLGADVFQPRGLPLDPAAVRAVLSRSILTRE